MVRGAPTFIGGMASGATGFGNPKTTTGRIGQGAGRLAGIGAIGLAMHALRSSANAGEDTSKYAVLAHPAMDKTIKGILKRGFNADKIRGGIDLASYLALMGPVALRVAAPDKYQAHAGLMHGLEAAGLTGLTGTSIHNLASQPSSSSWVPEAANIAGLALMGGGLLHSLHNH